MVGRHDGIDLPRLRADVWVAAYLRRCAWQGAFASLSRKGDESAGTIFLEILHANGNDLWMPAPGAIGRVFERPLKDVSGAELAESVAREVSFDRDLWLVTVEDRAGRDFLEAHERV